MPICVRKCSEAQITDVLPNANQLCVHRPFPPSH
jgi:hypothetical protein